MDSVVLILLSAFAYLRNKRQEDRKQKYALTARTDPEGYVSNLPGTLDDLIEQTSGSGQGLPLLVSHY